MPYYILYRYIPPYSVYRKVQKGWHAVLRILTLRYCYTYNQKFIQCNLVCSYNTGMLNTNINMYFTSRSFTILFLFLYRQNFLQWNKYKHTHTHTKL